MILVLSTSYIITCDNPELILSIVLGIYLTAPISKQAAGRRRPRSYLLTYLLTYINKQTENSRERVSVRTQE